MVILNPLVTHRAPTTPFPPRTLCLAVSGSTSPGCLPNSRLLLRGPSAGSSLSPQPLPGGAPGAVLTPSLCCLHSYLNLFPFHGLKCQPLVDDFQMRISSQMSPLLLWDFPSGVWLSYRHLRFTTAKRRLSTSQPLPGNGIIPLAQAPNFRATGHSFLSAPTSNLSANSGDSVFRIYLEATPHHPAAAPVVGPTVVSGLNVSDSSLLGCPGPSFHSLQPVHMTARLILKNSNSILSFF